MSRLPNLEYLPHVHELNRAFLGLLQSRARVELDCLGLPAGVRPTLSAANRERLDAVARFPRALFRLQLEQSGPEGSPEITAPLPDACHHHLCSSILWSLRHAARQSGYQARLLFGLEPATIHRLRAMQLPELQRLACAPGVITCAFARQEWLWERLLTDLRPEAQRQLALVALQPGVTREWPQRRPAQPVA